MSYYLKCFVFLIWIHQGVYSFVGIINRPGIYKIEDNITYDPTNNNQSIIMITSSDVILDLNQRILAQKSSNELTGIQGIDIAQNLSNVTIQNGTIRNVKGTGIKVNPGCKNIVISYINTFSCGTRAIDMDGASGQLIQDSLIEYCTMAQSCHCTSGDVVLRLDYGSNVRIDNCMIYNNANNSNSLNLIKLSNCTSCFVNNVKMLNNSAYAITCLELDSANRCSANNCQAQFNSATGSGQFMIGYMLQGSSNTNNILTACSSVQNASVGTCYGFDIRANSSGNIFEVCKSNGNTGTAVAGFRLTGAGTNDQNFFYSCFANNNGSTTGNADGFLVDGSDDGIMLNCVGSFNYSSNGAAAGIRFNSGSGGNNWFIKESNFIKNEGSSTGNSYGARVQAGNSNSFVNNFAFNNGTTSDNQLNGVPTGSKSNTTTSNLNTQRGFTNFQLTP